MSNKEDYIKLTRIDAKASVDQGLRTYMSHVYNYMTTGLLMSALVGFLVANTALQNLFFEMVAVPGGMAVKLTILGWLAIISPIILVFAINPVLARGNFKAGFAVFMLFSALFGVSIANILLSYTGISVTRIFLITAGMFAGTSIYGTVTRRDLTSMGSFFFMGLIGVLLAMVINFFLHSPTLYYVTSVIGVFVFVGLTAYDTQKIRQAYAATDGSSIMHSKAVIGALSLYLDFINLFMMLLSLFGERR